MRRTRQHRTREEREMLGGWLSGLCLLDPCSPKHALDVSKHSPFSRSHQERLHVLVSRPRKNSKQHLKEPAVLGKLCTGSLELVCAVMQRLPAPRSKFPRTAFRFTKQSLCSSCRLWPTLVRLTWYGLRACRKS